MSESHGCMLCSKPLQYKDSEQLRRCVFCDAEKMSHAACEQGHFVCDKCHAADALEVVRATCLASGETDMIALMKRIRAHEAINVHGPEHHALVPALIVTTYRNIGGEATNADIETAISRGASVPGGACGLFGSCGAAQGVGIGFGILLKSSPVKAAKRQLVLSATATVLKRLAAYEAARCCQRDCYLSLKAAAELSHEMLPIPLQADEEYPCRQRHLNKECLGYMCPCFSV
jgi:7,8-dihydro-6-hydroxymethylpterin dimethyltransferase